MEVSKRDWKLFQEKIGSWQKSYMERLIKDYAQLLDGPKPASEKFWELERRIKKDRKNPGVSISLDKSEMIYKLVEMIRLGVISFEDLKDFSDNLKEDVGFFMKPVI